MSAFWASLDRLVANSRLVIDRPAGSHHPRYPGLVYPLDYGYLEGTSSGDGAGIDVWFGASGARTLDSVIMTVDLTKRDLEVKLLLGCSPEEAETILDFHTGNNMQAIQIRRNEVG
jgi:inorganic pyrophosphatase